MKKYVGIKPFGRGWITDLPKGIKWFFQRGWNGYSASDTWDIADHLSEWMPNAVREMRDRGIGWPTTMYDFVDDTEEEAAESLWANILTDIADGFESHHILNEMPWLRDAPDSKFVTDENGRLRLEADPFYEWLQEHDQEIKEMEQALADKRDFGLALFVEFYPCLWD